MKQRSIKVLIVDDSALVRQSLQKMLEQDPSIEVIGAASDPYFAARIIAREAPDVITLDIQMPKMNGLTFLQKIMTQHPIPVVVISTLAKENSDIALKAWQYGAIEVIEKPILKTREFFENSSRKICDAIKAASIANLKKKSLKRITPIKQLDESIYADRNVSSAFPTDADKVVLIGASAGGTEVIANILSQLPKRSPPVVIVQHMPKQFTQAFANRLNDLSQLTVKEAQKGDRLAYGTAFVAPGNMHVLIKQTGQAFSIETNQGPPLNRHRPSVDMLFTSAQEYDAKHFLAAILSGMGRDGVEGLVGLKNNGVLTLAQNEESCIVYGMPKEAVKAGAACKILTPEEMVKEIMKFRWVNV